MTSVNNNMKRNVLYIHGFNSSPLSIKAEQTRQYLVENYPGINYHCPQLATTPQEAVSQLETIIERGGGKDNAWYLIGSSLGGYFASYLTEKLQCMAVLVNPAIKPYELLHDYLGEQVNPYTEEVFQVTEEHMVQLKAIEQRAPTKNNQQKNNYLVMVQTGDEVLNYQQAVEKYQFCQLIVQEGGDHSFINFDQCLAGICDFFQFSNHR